MHTTQHPGHTTHRSEHTTQQPGHTPRSPDGSIDPSRVDWLHGAGLLLVAGASLLWYIGLWPGSMSHDSVYLLHEAEAGIYSEEHPVLNAVLLRLFVVPFGSIAVYSALQALLGTAVIVFVLRRLRSAGMPAAVSLACALAVAVSIPIGVYESILWKDVPTSFMVLLFATIIFLTVLGIGPRIRNGATFAVYCAAIALLCFLRHGWEINLLLVPLLLTVLGKPSRRQRAALWGGCLLVFIAIDALLPRAITIRNNEERYADMVLYSFVQPFMSMLGSRTGYVSPDAAADLALYRKLFDGDEAIGRYTPSHFEPVFRSLKPKAGLQFDTADKLRIVADCTLNVQLCLADRFAMFVNTLYPVTPLYGMTFYNQAALSDCRALLRAADCDLLEQYARPSARNPLTPIAARLVAYSQSIVSPYPRAWIWNALPGFLFLCAALLSSRWLPATASAALFILIQALVPFATSAANDFRYYFFIYLCGIFIVPMAITEIVRHRKLAPHS